MRIHIDCCEDLKTVGIASLASQATLRKVISVNFDLQLEHPSPHRFSLSDSVSPSTSNIADAACETIDGVTLQ
jgi:hypothetical protein